MVNLPHYVLFKSGQGNRLPLRAQTQIQGLTTNRENHVLLVESHIPPDPSVPGTLGSRHFGVIAVDPADLHDRVKVGIYGVSPKEPHLNLSRIHPVQDLTSCLGDLLEIWNEGEHLKVKNTSALDFRLSPDVKLKAGEQKTLKDTDEVHIPHPESAGGDFVVYFPTIKSFIRIFSEAMTYRHGLDYATAPVAKKIGGH